MKDLYFELWCVLLALLSALTLCGLLLLYMGESPLEVYGVLLQGSLGEARYLNMTLRTSVPYLFCGLSLALAFRGGLFNIGAEGQLFAGALAGALVGRFLVYPGFGTIGVLFVTMLAGGLWALPAIWLKIRFGVHEVINTIMLNYIMFSLCAFVVRQPSIRVDPTVPRTADVAAQAQLGAISLGGVSIGVGLLLGVALAWVLFRVLRDSRWGYELHVVGVQPEAAENAGISMHRTMLICFLLSGGIAGLAGGLYVLSPLHPHFEMGFSPGWGFWGIALALLARNHPIGVIAAALLFGMLETGGSYLDTTRGIPGELVQILEALIILMIASRLFHRLLARDTALVPSQSAQA